MTALLAVLAALQIVQIIASSVLEVKRMKLFKEDRKIAEQERRGVKFY